MNLHPPNTAQAFAYSSAGSQPHHATEPNDQSSTNQNPGQPPYFINEPTETFNYHQGPYISPADENWSQNGGHSATPSSAHSFQVQTSQGPFHPGAQHSLNWDYYPPQAERLPSSFAQPPPLDQWPMQLNASHLGSNGGTGSFAAVHSTQGSNSDWPYPSSTSSGSYPPHLALYPHGNREMVPSMSYSQDHPSSSSGGPSFNRVQNAGYSPSITPLRADPFYGFPNGDDSRVLSYHESSNHTEQTNKQLLGVEPPLECEDPGSVPSYSAPVLPPVTPHSEPVVSAQRNEPLPEVQSEEDRKKLEYFENCLPGDKALPRKALLLWKEDWLRSDKAEPPFGSGADQNLPNSPSRFDAYFSPDGDHACHWTVDGEKCTHTAPRRERALGHARFHFDYKPFHCAEKCGIIGCTHKYHCQSALKDHVRRKGNPSGSCSLCRKPISVQNMKRHMKTHEPKRSKISRVAKALSSVGKAIKRTLSRPPSPSPETQ